MLITYRADEATGLWLPESLEHKTQNTKSFEVVEGKSEFRNCRALPRTPR